MRTVWRIALGVAVAVFLVDASMILISRNPGIAENELAHRLSVPAKDPAFQYVFRNATFCKAEGLFFNPSDQECEALMLTLIDHSQSLSESDRVKASQMVHPIVDWMY